ncbi:MAG: ABC transporter ATP-binding protein [Nitriliruptorales bacterium]|nr:ABC transporter ATP-binding protein [Nitriliruptorales bacterium]
MSATLELDGVSGGYGKVQVLRDLSFVVPAGSVVALVGPNGVGKTSTLRAITGLLDVTGGDIRLDGQRLNGLATSRIARSGVVLIPEGRGIFPGLTVGDNLEAMARAVGTADPDARIQEALELFPRLAERRTQRAGTLSGGEQQMLAMSRAFLADPKVLLLDEISMGLAPLITEDLFTAIAELKELGVTILLVEQFLTHALRLADLCYVMSRGTIVYRGDPGEIASGAAVAEYLGSTALAQGAPGS